jgi:hypothetical protein
MDNGEIGILKTITSVAGARLVKELLSKQEIVNFAYAADGTPDNHYIEYTVAFTSEKLIILSNREPRRANNKLYLVDSKVIPRDEFLVYSISKPDKQKKYSTLDLWVDGFIHLTMLFADSENIDELIRFIEETAVISANK